jgi:hypothetical protein
LIQNCPDDDALQAWISQKRKYPVIHTFKV